MPEPLIRAGRTNDEAEDKRARDLKTDLRELLSAPLLRGVLLEVAAPASGTVRVPHRLGRVPQGWIVVDNTVVAHTLHRDSWDDVAIVFGSTVACNVKLWVY